MVKSEINKKAPISRGSFQTKTQNKYAKHIGYKPHDNGEDYRKKIEKKHGFIDSKDPLVTTHGGYFASVGHFDD